MSKRPLFELLMIGATIFGKFLFMDFLGYRFAFVIVACAFWLGYIIYSYRTNAQLFQYWGFRTDNFRKTLKMVLPFGLISVLTFIVIGYFQGTLNPTWHIIPILITYPIWGTIQQYLLIALVAGNLHDMKHLNLKKWQVILFSSILFSLVHYPEYWLMFGTFVLALFYGIIYLKERNLYVLGLFHGWLGGLFYYTVVNRDPFLETFGKLIGN